MFTISMGISVEKTMEKTEKMWYNNLYCEKSGSKTVFFVALTDFRSVKKIYLYMEDYQHGKEVLLSVYRR